MRTIQPGQNNPIAGNRIVVSVRGEPEEDFARKVRAGAFLLNKSGQVESDADFINESNSRSTEGAIVFEARQRSFNIELDALAGRVEKIAIFLAVHSGFGRGTTVGTFAAIKALLADNTGAPQLEFSPPLASRSETALILAEIYRYKSQWKFRAIGQGFGGGLTALAHHFGLAFREPEPPPPSPGAAPAPNQRGNSFSGTGFCVNAAGYFLTNHHVIEGATDIQARSPRAQYRFKHVFSDPVNDLALLKTDEPVTDVAVFRDGVQARLGENVLVIGYPLRGLLGSSAQVTTGNVSSLIGIRDDTRALQFTAPVQSGNSGGPLLDMDGAVIGVVSAKLDAAKIHELTGDVPQNVNFAIKSALVCSFLEAVGIEYQRRPGATQRSSAEIATEAQGFVVRIECQG